MNYNEEQAKKLGMTLDEYLAFENNKYEKEGEAKRLRFIDYMRNHATDEDWQMLAKDWFNYINEYGSDFEDKIEMLIRD